MYTIHTPTYILGFFHLNNALTEDYSVEFQNIREYDNISSRDVSSFTLGIDILSIGVDKETITEKNKASILFISGGGGG
eukprot:snap_masked-scaffold_27-processed-gene-4.48-mRNA-1 protein AED:1.00 eAED:1.00 QI:0/0/0/0/1/1/2/0/78